MTGNATAAALTNNVDSVKFFMLDLGFVCRHPLVTRCWTYG